MIKTAAHILLRVTTPEDYEREQRRAVQQVRSRGGRVLADVIATPVDARIDCGRWLIDCVCGNGILVDPRWSEGRCFECGTVYLAVIFPEAAARDAIEQVLTQRAEPDDQNWTGAETITELRADNLAQGIALNVSLDDPTSGVQR